MEHKKRLFSQSFEPNKAYWDMRKKQKEESRKWFMERMRGLDFTAIAKYITRKFSWEEE